MHTLITKYHPDGFQLEINCEETELKEYTLQLISDFEISFTFDQLCFELARLLDNKQLFQKEPNTHYEGELQINSKVRMIIHQYIWELIWDKKLMIDLYVSKYRQNNHNIYLMKTDFFND